MVAAVPPPPINRFPLGLLGFVDIKAMGENPRYLDGRVQSTMDLTKWYMAEARDRYLSTVMNPAAPAVNWAAPNIPSPQMWLLESVWVDVTAVIGAGITWKGGVCIGRVNQNGATGTEDVMTVLATGLTAATGDASIVAHHYFAQPFLMLPTWRFGLITQSVAGGAPSFRIGASFLRIDT